MNYKTKILHAGRDTCPYTGASSIPIYQASTFAQEDPVTFGPYKYGRSSNPTREALEHTMAVLEGGSHAFAFASGMAAISSVLLLFKPGDHIIVTEDVYGGTYRVLDEVFKRWELRYTFADLTDEGQVRAALRPETKAIFVETPSNPILKITDLAAIARFAKGKGLLTIIDNTFMSPYLQRPIELGFDIVIHSATKFLGGHSDVIGGVTVTTSKRLAARLREIQVGFGAILGPMDSWLLLRGIKTLAVRMEAQQRSAEKIARWLVSEPGIARVYYPTLDDHPGRDVHLRQASGGGAIVSFELPNGDKARDFLRAVKLPIIAISLGGTDSILSYPASMSHAAMPADERQARGISDALVRLSVGLEDVDDLIEDMEAALESVRS
jgi:cysteine-S-conjugate beta-lyase